MEKDGWGREEEKILGKKKNRIHPKKGGASEFCFHLKGEKLHRVNLRKCRKKMTICKE